MIQESTICIKMKERLKQKRVNHKPVPDDKDIHLFHELLDMIDRSANTNDYNIPQVKPKPTEPTQSVIDLPKPLQAPAILLSLEAIKEEPDLESEGQESEQDGIDVIPVEENLSKEMNKNKQCINNYSKIEIVDSKCDNSSTNPGTDMEHGTILKLNSISNPNSNPQFNDYSKIERAKEEVIELPQSDNRDQKVSQLPAPSGE